MSALQCDASLGHNFASPSQRARVVTEAWVEEHGYCLACDSNKLIAMRPGTQVRDFECDQCAHPYELKSSSKPFGVRVVDGAYSAMMQRIETASVPNLLLLQYDSEWNVLQLLAIHRLFLTAEVIEQRKPLSMTARRSGWVGCNILLQRVPPEGRISLTSAGGFLDRSFTRSKYAATEKFAPLPPPARGWLSSVLLGLHKLQKLHFTIADAYTLEPSLALQYPLNGNIRPKIRQQLQIMRDSGIIVFDGNGRYHFPA